MKKKDARNGATEERVTMYANKSFFCAPHKHEIYLFPLNLMPK